MVKFSLGTDPEFMLSKNGKIYSAIGIVKGTKDRRKKIGKHAFYYDNVLAEAAVAPGFTKKEAIDNIGECLKLYAQLVAPYRLEAKASHDYPVDQLKHKDSFKIGCDPEACAYSGMVIEPDEQLFLKTNLRSAGGHIHLGCKDLLKDHPILSNYAQTVSIFLMDLFLGIPSILLDHDPTTKQRKQLYGQAGRWRFPPYGVEYRSMGNFWLSSPKLVSLVYDISEFVLDLLVTDRWQSLWTVDVEQLNDREAWSRFDFHPSKCFNCVGYDVKSVRNAIDAMDVKAGNKIMQDIVRQYMPNDLYDEILKLTTAKEFDLHTEWKIA